MVGWIIITFAALLLYSLLGVAIWSILLDIAIYKLSDNPLWRLPAAVFWPVALLVVSIIGLYVWFIQYCKEVRDYYKDKKGT